MEDNIPIILIMLSHISQYSQYDDTLFSFTSLYVPNSAFFFRSILVLSFYIDVVQSFYYRLCCTFLYNWKAMSLSHIIPVRNIVQIETGRYRIKTGLIRLNVKSNTQKQFSKGRIHLYICCVHFNGLNDRFINRIGCCLLKFPLSKSANYVCPCS